MARAADRRIVSKLARGPLFSRLFGSGKSPLRLVAVPRDHVVGDKKRGESLLAGRYTLGSETLDLGALDWGALDLGGPVARDLHGFGWLRDLAAAASRERGAGVAEHLASGWLLAHGTKPDEAWDPELWGLRILHWTAYAPYILSSRDAAYRSALLNTLSRGIRHVAAQGDKAAPGLARITAASGAVVGALALPGAGASLAKAENQLLRALASAQYEDGGLTSRSPAEQVRLVDRLGLVRAAYFAAKQAMPDALEDAAAAALAALHGVTMGDGRLSSWQGGNPATAAQIAALVEGCGMRARPLRSPRGWGYHRLSALGTILVVDAAPPPSPRAGLRGAASTLGVEISDGAQRLVVNCGGPGLDPTDLPDELLHGLQTTAAHSALVLDDTNSTAILEDGSLGKGVVDVAIERGEDNDQSTLVASHDGYVKPFGLVHERRIALGNDGKTIVGEDRLLPKGRRRIGGAAPVAIRFHLAPGVEPTLTADGMGALLRSKGAPPWTLRATGGTVAIEDSLHIDGRGIPHPTLQLVLAGEVSAVGGEFGWQLRRSS